MTYGQALTNYISRKKKQKRKKKLRKNKRKKEKKLMKKNRNKNLYLKVIQKNCLNTFQIYQKMRFVIIDITLHMEYNS